jgi:membrane-associated phospholipid phosphatase
VKKRQIGAAIFLFCSLLTVISYNYWDIPLAYYCRKLSLEIISIAQIVTIAGESQWYYFLFVFLFLIFRLGLKNKSWSDRFLFLFVSISASGLINTLFKWIAGRSRPINLFAHNQFGFDYFKMIHESTSLPSGHAVTAFTLATGVSILFPRLSIPAFVIAVIIGASRIMITSHYLSDVFVGAGVAILCTLAVKYFFDRYNMKLDGRYKN